MTERPYPEPPWQMHGRGLFASFRVPARELDLPQGMSPVTIAGQALGLLAYIEYLPPSPLTYRELIFMPCMVRARTETGSVKTGYWVSRMYVDSEASLRGGRELWALPKTLAHFAPNQDGVDVEAEDGTRLGLSFRARGPKLPVKNRVLTLQRDEADWVRFRGVFSARMQLAQLKVAHFDSSDPGWRGFEPRRRLPLPGVRFSSFDSEMQAPNRYEAERP